MIDEGFMEISKNRKSISKPKQNRSKKTMENLLNTAKQMLIDSSFEKANIQDIVKRANSSVGSFYSLFRSKNNLLECLLDNYQSWLTDLAINFNENNRIENDLEVRVKVFVSEYIKRNREEAGILRARFIHSLNKDYTIPESRMKLIRRFEEELYKFFKPVISEINHPEPLRALEFIVDVVDVFVGEKIMFEKFKNTKKYKSNDFFEMECVRLVLNYLGYKSGGSK